MANFNYSAALTIHKEGGDKLTDDPRDPGGMTKFGVAARYHPGVDIANLEGEETLRIYREKYWNIVRGDNISSQHLANTLFDHAIHDGPSDAVALLQGALNTLGLSLLEDGIMGSKTLAACASISGTSEGEAILINAFNAGRLLRYYDKVRRHPARDCYLEGWWKRAASFAVFLGKDGRVRT